MILDVCSPFENWLQAFQKARRVKEEKYTPVQWHLQWFQRMMVDAIVVGCLGTWDPANDRILCRICSQQYPRTKKRLS